MKKFNLLILLLLILVKPIYPDRQHVHQRIVVEGYGLLKKWLGDRDIPAMHDKIGGLSAEYVGTAPWQLGYVTTGAWREDCEDVVYNICADNPPTVAGFTMNMVTGLGNALGSAGVNLENNDGFVSTTHFWYADNGDDIATDFTGTIDFPPIYNNPFQFTIPNAYQKIRELAYGKHLIYQKYIRDVPLPSGYLSTLMFAQRITFQFNIIDLYKNGKLYVSEIQTLGENYSYSQPFRFTENMWDALNGISFDQFKAILVWESLGRMCHLLQDMGVPAHTNVDPHGGSGLIYDSFENYFGDIGWTADMVYNQNPIMLDPTTSSNPLHFLMYTLNQQTNHFASNGPHMNQNNDYFGGNPLPEEISYLNNLNVASYGLPVSMQGSIPEPQVLNMRDKLIPQAIRATAGLLYWFAVETGLVSKMEIVTNYSVPLLIINGQQQTTVPVNITKFYGDQVTFEATQQEYNGYDFVWNTTYPNAKSTWQRKLKR